MVKDTLVFMQNQGLSLPLLLDAIFYGDSGCHSDPTVQYQRTALMVSDELPGILDRWYTPPPRGDGHKGGRPRGARRILDTFAEKVVKHRVDHEMKSMASLFISPPNELSEKQLTGVHFDKLIDECQLGAPTMWNIFRHAAYTPRQDAHNTHKNPNMVVLSMISQCQYTRSHRRGRIAKLWAIYLKACGTSARAFDAIHTLGLTMSHKWTSNAYRTLSKHAMDALRQRIHEAPYIISHDNVNIPLRVFSQREHHQSHFMSGCAGTIWVLPGIAPLSSGSNRLLQEHRANMSNEPFPFAEVLKGSPEVDQRMREQNIHLILSVLMNSPEFEGYTHRDDPILQRPPPVHQLPYGKEHIVEQYILETAPIEEASYDGNDKIVEEWFRQLGLDSPDEKIRTGLDRVLVWIGDQMTVDRLRGLWRYRFEDDNSFDRMDYMIPTFGWFHLVMAFAVSLHRQYLGTSAAVGKLKQAFDMLNRKGLLTPGSKGPFWNDLDEALRHISEGHFRTCWLTITGTGDLGELKEKPPQELREFASCILDEYASRAAIVKLQMSLPPGKQDLIKEQHIMWNSDILPYLNLTDAMKHGDVGRMEDLLPTLMFRFAGGKNPKYTIETLELWQQLHREWPEEVRNFVREHCWLINRSGEPDGFLAIDLGQEQNIKDIKVTYRSFGPGATFKYLHDISPAIPILRTIQRHMEDEFKTLTRGAKHRTVSKEEDVKTLTQQYLANKLYVTEAGRKPKPSDDKIEDVITTGADNLERNDIIANWWKARCFPRSTTEIW
ncbi:hypothetical protein BD779DRAFT_1447822 [Infundibulicybe gibba]|nr:hypothetical protein BD779DRAFT_1447822 [Infundibulicybe gibba]